MTAMDSAPATETITISLELYNQLLQIKSERDDLKTQLATAIKQRDALRNRSYQQHLHSIEGSMYLHDLRRGNKTDMRNLNVKTITEDSVFIKPGVVHYDPTGKNKRGRFSWYKGHFETIKTLEERPMLYNIEACEREVKDTFKENGWRLVDGGQEYFERPADDETIHKMRRVFLDTTARFMDPPLIDDVVPLPSVDGDHPTTSITTTTKIPRTRQKRRI
jgi:hypothetical protein